VVAAKVKEDAAAQAEVKLQDALRRIEQERDNALREIRAEAVDLAIAAAGKLVSVSMDPSQQRRLVEQYIKDLPQIAAEGPAS
jgi:F-type H+-transporting ATPase subunit b